MYPNSRHKTFMFAFFLTKYYHKITIGGKIMNRRGKKILYKVWMEEWLNEKKNYVKESTYANYSNIVYNHLIPQLGNYRLRDINNQMLQRLIINKYQFGRLDNNGGLSDKTVKDIGTVIKLSLKSAMKSNLIDYIDLDFYYPKKNHNMRMYIFSKDEQRHIIYYCLNHLDLITLGILLSLYSGIRIGELCALKWKDIDLKKNILRINKTIQRIYLKENRKSKIIITTPKTKNANREIPINRDFAVILRQFKINNEYYFLTNKNKCMEPRTFRRHYYDIIEKIGINTITFHSLRHTFASNCIRLGVDYKTVSELLGHASVNITLNIYVHPQMSEKKRCINLIYRENNNIVFDNDDQILFSEPELFINEL